MIDRKLTQADAVPLGAVWSWPGFWARSFYVVIALVLMAIVFWGFWPSYFGPLPGTGLTRPWIFHLHAAVFVGWLVLLLAQASLAAAGRLRMHRRLGALGVAYAALVPALGLMLSFIAPAMHVRSGSWEFDEAAAFMLLPLGDMALFAGFFAAAIAYRVKPELHKRLMLAASVALV
jgi:hypothetical protein